MDSKQAVKINPNASDTGQFMEYSISPSEDHKYIILKIIGEFTAKDMMQCIVESHTLGRAMDIHCYLVDAINARNIDSIMGNYEFAYSDMKTTEGVDPAARVAGLVSPGDHSHDFVETVSENAGMDLKLFTDPAEAKGYLLKKTPSDKARREQDTLIHT